MIMAHGVKSLSMAQCGTRARSMSVGLPIATDIGTGSARGAGLGWITRPGDSRLITMDVGRLSADLGAGALARFMRVRSMDRRSSDLWVEDTLVLGSDLAEGLAAESGGSRSDTGNRFIRGITPATFTCET
jgi:hypothetical protein